MVSTFDEVRRYALAIKLSDLKFLQEVLLTNTECLIHDCGDERLMGLLRHMASQERAALGSIANVIFQFGPVEASGSGPLPMSTTLAVQIVRGAEYSLAEKLAQQESLNHQFVLMAEAVRGAAVTLGENVGNVLLPVQEAAAVARLHQEQLERMVELVAARELTGSEPQGVIVSDAEPHEQEEVAGLA